MKNMINLLIFNTPCVADLDVQILHSPEFVARELQTQQNILPVSEFGVNL